MGRAFALGQSAGDSEADKADNLSALCFRNFPHLINA